MFLFYQIRILTNIAILRIDDNGTPIRSPICQYHFLCCIANGHHTVGMSIQGHIGISDLGSSTAPAVKGIHTLSHCIEIGLLIINLNTCGNKPVYANVDYLHCLSIHCQCFGYLIAFTADEQNITADIHAPEHHFVLRNMIGNIQAALQHACCGIDFEQFNGPFPISVCITGGSIISIPFFINRCAGIGRAVAAMGAQIGEQTIAGIVLY